MRWYTCTPVAFGGGPDFFARDSGLLSRGFQQLGVESRAVMPGPAQPGDEPDLIRTDFALLESADWWRAQQLDGVVLYAWGVPKYRHIARAIHQSGAKLVLVLDNAGYLSPRVDFRDWAGLFFIGASASLSSQVRAWFRFIKALVGAAIWVDWTRAVHLKQADWIGCVSPKSVALHRRLCAIYGGVDLVKRVALVPHPITPDCALPVNSPRKQKQIVAIGRWDDARQKRPQLMMEVLEKVLSADAEISVEIIGGVTSEMETWHRNAGNSRARITLHGRRPHETIGAILRSAQVYYCSSAYESFNIAAGEALCCGAAVVASRKPAMGAFEWFISKHSGTIAERDTPQSHADAILEELRHWENGERDPMQISRDWSALLHADRVASEILRLCGDKGLAERSDSSPAL